MQILRIITLASVLLLLPSGVRASPEEDFRELQLELARAFHPGIARDKQEKALRYLFHHRVNMGETAATACNRRKWRKLPDNRRGSLVSFLKALFSSSFVLDGLVGMHIAEYKFVLDDKGFPVRRVKIRTWRKPPLTDTSLAGARTFLWILHYSQTEKKWYIQDLDAGMSFLGVLRSSLQNGDLGEISAELGFPEWDNPCRRSTRE